MPSTDRPVLVTGATGFAAAEIVRQLLERSHRVRGTTPDLLPPSTRELTSLPGAEESLHLAEADLLVDGGLDSVDPTITEPWTDLERWGLLGKSA